MAITPESSQRGIILSDDKEFTAPTSRLSADPVSDAWDITYPWLNIEAAMNTDGNYRDPFTNTRLYVLLAEHGKRNGSGRMTLDIMSVHLNVDKAIRILLIENIQSIGCTKNRMMSKLNTTPYRSSVFRF